MATAGGSAVAATGGGDADVAEPVAVDDDGTDASRASSSLKSTNIDAVVVSIPKLVNAKKIKMMKKEEKKKRSEYA